MSKTLLIVTLALVAAANAKPYISALSSFYAPTGPLAAAYTLPGAPFAPAAVPAGVAPGVALPAAVAAPASPYAAEFAPAFPYGGVSPLVNYGPSAYVPQAYGYAYNDAYIYRR